MACAAARALRSFGRARLRNLELRCEAAIGRLGERAADPVDTGLVGEARADDLVGTLS